MADKYKAHGWYADKKWADDEPTEPTRPQGNPAAMVGTVIFAMAAALSTAGGVYAGGEWWPCALMMGVYAAMFGWYWRDTWKQDRDDIAHYGRSFYR